MIRMNGGSLLLFATLVAVVSTSVATATHQTAVPPPAVSASRVEAQYAGSASCRRCHLSTYERWAKTRMANVITDPKEHPSVVLADFSKPNPLLTFTLADVAFVYGTRWKQRYFTRVGDDYFPLPAQWDITNRVWRPYVVQPNTDWWVPHYPADNMQRPTGPLCDGCHSVNYDIRTKSVTEWNVGCERCHGPGGEHVRQPTTANIINPAKLDAVRANDTCIQCHSQGQPIANPQQGQYFDWPVGFHQGGRLADFWRLEAHTPGETSFTHFADGTAHKNRMQGNDYVQSQMYKRGVTCFGCHDVHGTANPADVIKPSRDLCLTCHGAMAPNGPRAASIPQHTHHAAGSAGSECIACHMPKIEQTIADVNVRSHTFRFVMPSESDRLKVPNACVVCHKDRSNTWATEQLRQWPEISPWRVGR